MTLTTATANRKDRNAGPAKMEHRQFAAIACTIRSLLGLNDMQRSYVAECFASELSYTNPRFDRARFLAACQPD